jgi:hypothetical protein
MNELLPTDLLERKLAELQQLEDLGDLESARVALIARVKEELAFRRVLIRIFESQEVSQWQSEQ